MSLRPHVSAPFPRALRVLALAALVVTPPAAMAQDPSIVMQTWQLFLDHCGRAYADPQRYVDDVSAGQDVGVLNIAGTPDGQIFWLSITGTVLSTGYSMIVVEDRRLQSCTAMAVLDGNSSTSPVMNAAFLEALAQRPEVLVTGGAMPETSLGMGGDAGIEAGTYRYAVLGALPQQIVTEVVFSPWSIEFLSVHTDGPP